MKVITIANQKGGVAKTTTATVLAHGLALKGKRTLVIDLDPQGQAAVALGLEAESGIFNWLIAGRPVGELLRQARENLWVLPGDKQTGYVQILWSAQNRGIDALKQEIKKLNDFHYVVIDTSPSVGGMQERGLYASDLVLVPTATDFLSADAVAGTMETMTANMAMGWQGRLLGILPTFYDETTRESQATLADLRETYGEQVLRPIHRATLLRECAAEGKTIWEKDPISRAGREYAILVYQSIEA